MNLRAARRGSRDSSSPHALPALALQLKGALLPGCHEACMRTLGWLANMAVFVLLANHCGKSIEKRNWEQSVAYFLLALGTILYLVKNTPTF
jgi:hypothetical protein